VPRYHARELLAHNKEQNAEEGTLMARRAYAEVWWTVQDILDAAKENEVELTKNEARQLLTSVEKGLEGSMIAAGWTVIENALSELEHFSGQPRSGH